MTDDLKSDVAGHRSKVIAEIMNEEVVWEGQCVCGHDADSHLLLTSGFEDETGDVQMWHSWECYGREGPGESLPPERKPSCKCGEFVKIDAMPVAKA